MTEWTSARDRRSVRILGALRWSKVAAVVVATAMTVLMAVPAAAEEAGSAPARSSTVSLGRISLADHRAQLNAFKIRVDSLRSKLGGVEARVAGLKQTVLVGAVMATRARLVHRNEMSGSFRLERAVYRLDGEEIFSRSGDSLSDAKEIVLFDGPLTAGSHQIQVEMMFRGASVGVFTYLQGYKFKVRSRYLLDVIEGRNTVLKIVAFEADDITVEAKDRFKVRYDVEVNDESSPVAP